MARKTAPLSFRIDEHLRAALEAAAAADRRSLSSLVTIILSDWATARGIDLPQEAKAILAPAKYKPVPGRPRKAPGAVDPWLERQIDAHLDRSQYYDLNGACVAAVKKPLSAQVQYFDKALEVSLLRARWTEAVRTTDGATVWVANERIGDTVGSTGVNE